MRSCTIQLSLRYPFLRYDSSFEALYDPRAGVLYADKCVRAMQVPSADFYAEG